ncbi:MAG: hypothetical protein OSA42_09395, partial [Porticoccaceae bacterium]|nr:hypothetical protein [Porticoccaceae bacterium]
SHNDTTALVSVEDYNLNIQLESNQSGEDYKEGKVGKSGADIDASWALKTYEPGTFKYVGDVVSDVRISDRDAIVAENSKTESTNQNRLNQVSLVGDGLVDDDFDALFVQQERGTGNLIDDATRETDLVTEVLFGEPPAEQDSISESMVNPEELGLLKFFDDSELPEDEASRVVEPLAPATDLQDELMGFEKFLQIQSTLVKKIDGDDKSGLSLYNIDSLDVKFSIVATYVEEGNVDGARDLLLEMIEQAVGDDRDKARALLETL